MRDRLDQAEALYGRAFAISERPGLEREAAAASRPYLQALGVYEELEDPLRRAFTLRNLGLLEEGRGAWVPAHTALDGRPAGTFRDALRLGP